MSYTTMHGLVYAHTYVQKFYFDPFDQDKGLITISRTLRFDYNFVEIEGENVIRQLGQIIKILNLVVCACFYDMYVAQYTTKNKWFGCFILGMYVIFKMRLVSLVFS